MVKSILRKFVPDYEVRAYGSRVSGTARLYSDLDLEIVGCEAIGDERIDSLKEAFALSDLPIVVDVQDRCAISPAFRRVIDRQFEIVQRANEV